MAIFVGVFWIALTFLLPETYAPVLLRKRAEKLSKMTGKVYKSRGDVEQGPTTLGHAVKTALTRPWILLFREPIVFLLSIYMAIVYGTLYMLFAAFPIVYQQGTHCKRILNPLLVSASDVCFQNVVGAKALAASLSLALQ